MDERRAGREMGDPPGRRYAFLSLRRVVGQCSPGASTLAVIARDCGPAAARSGGRVLLRSEERRVGKEGSYRRWEYDDKKKVVTQVADVCRLDLVVGWDLLFTHVRI